MAPVQRPRCNRLTPFGTFERSAARGSIMGNRGDLHGPDGEITRSWRGRAWIACNTTSATGYRVSFDSPRHYTPLFALDEATILAAGHRPCSQCRRGALHRFRAAWAAARHTPIGEFVSASTIDIVLHTARLDGAGRQRTYTARLSDLPDGTIVARMDASAAAERSPETASLLWQGHMHPWSQDGYGRPAPAAPDAEVQVLTPEPIVAVMRAGYAPEVAL